jgi:hypothetical protein
MADSSSPSKNKRGQLTIHQPIQQKKTRNDTQVDHAKYASQDLWFGFQAMELIASDNNIPHREINTPIRELLRLGFRESEAAEIHTAKISFPRVQQQKWPSTRTDGRSGHHYHITQVPSDIEIDTNTGFALVYHILLNFEKPSTSYTSQEIVDMTTARFVKMDIELGELREPIAPLCNSKKDTWNGIIRVHLKRPTIDGNALLAGTRVFTLEIDEETTIAKVSRGFDNTASNEDLTLKITSKSLSNLPSHKLLESIIRDSFNRFKEIEIIQILKGVDQEYTYIVASSPEQRSKIFRSAVVVEGELITPTLIREKLTAAEIAKKNYLVLIAKNLNKGLTSEQIESGLRTLIGDKNVVNVYFPRSENEMHAGIVNVELLNASIYKKILKTTYKLQNKYVRFNPHPRSLDGSTVPSKETLKHMDFQDVNAALANTVVALENTTAPPKKSEVAKDEITALMKEAISEGNQTLKRKLRADMATLKDDILAESHLYTDIMTQDLRTKIDGQFDNIDNQFKAMMESLSTARKLLLDTPQRKALHSPEQDYSN